MPAEVPIPPNRLSAGSSAREANVRAFTAEHAELVEWLYARAAAGRWGLPRGRFAQALQRSVQGRFREERVRAEELRSYLESLHLQDLALACACSAGIAEAWEYFLREYREELYSAARAILGRRAGGDEAQARDLADSLYTDLYGVGTRGSDGQPGTAGAAERKPLLDYFHGRSKLSTWLRAVLAQRHVDALRAARRIEPLDEQDKAQARRVARGARRDETPDPDRARIVALLQAVLLDALGALEPRDRLRLAYYYVHERTLAEIGRLLGEHEATASRHLERARRQVRSQVERALREGRGGAGGLTEAQIASAFQYALEDWPFDLTRALDEGHPRSANAPERKG